MGNNEAIKPLEQQHDELLALAVRVANLNPDAGEIGPGMLTQLVDAARAAIAKAAS